MRCADVVAETVVLLVLHASEQVASVSTMTKNVVALNVLLAVDAVVIVSFCSAVPGIHGAMA
jgi:hypothetical protein